MCLTKYLNWSLRHKHNYKHNNKEEIDLITLVYLIGNLAGSFKKCLISFNR